MGSTRWGAVGLTLLLLQACSRPVATGASCQWPPEPARQLDLSQRADVSHLAADAAGAEDLAIRWADLHVGRRSPHFNGMAAYGVSRDSCMRVLFSAVAAVHAVTPAQVARLADRRPLFVDVLVVGSFCLLCVGLLYGIGAEPFVRRIGEESRGVRVAVLIAAAPVAALLWVGVGQFWSTTIESIRIGSSHLSNRALRLPFAAHEDAFFVAGMLLFWATMTLRLRRQRDHRDVR